MANDNLSFSWELKGKVDEQIRNALNDSEELRKVLEKIASQSKKELSTQERAEAAQKNIVKNVQEAEKALYKLMDAREKIDKALSRNSSMRKDGFLGMDESEILRASARIDEIVNQVMNIGSAAGMSKSAVKDLLASLSADLAIKDAKSLTSNMDKGLDRQVKERAKAQKEAVKEIEGAFKDADKAAAINAKNQELVKDALAKIATARANLTSASEKGNQQEIAHAQLLMNLLDRLAGKLNAIKGTFLGEKGALDGILGSGYLGLMRNVSAAIKDIGNVGSNVIQSPVKLIAEQDTSAIRSQIDLIGALHTQIKRLYEELGRAANNSNRLMPTNWQELAGRGLYNNKLPYVEQMEFLKKLRAYDGDMAQQKAVVEENIRKLQSQLDVYREAGINVQGYQNHLNALYETYVKLNALQTTDISAKLGLEHLRGYTGPQSALSDEAWASARREAEVREVAAQAAEKHRKKLAELTEAFDRQAKAEEKERQAQAQATAQKERATQAAHKQAQASAESRRNLNNEASEVVRLRLEMLKTQAVQLQGLIKNGKDTFDVAQIEQYRLALRDVVREITTLKGVMSNIDSFTGRNGSGLMAFGSGTNYAPLIAHGQHALDASRAVQQLTESERRFVEQISNATNALGPHVGVLRDLQTLATQYLSIWGARNVVNSIIETGGLLEQQRLSIGAILGDMDKAEEIFGQIKNLALKSPFGVVELDKMSKQLTAYGFQYEELFDWTKRLADISAATGTEVSRLALALGHVRNEKALSGYTLRQFSMANVPLAGKLAESRGVSVKEIRELVRKKEISDKEVQDVLMSLTNEGGMFYNAQEIMSGALNAKYKNLRDAFDIMYGEIAESEVGDVLKDIASILTDGAKQWKRFGTDILAVGAAFVTVKGAMLAYRAVLAPYTALVGKSTTATLKSALASKKQEAAVLKLASVYRKLEPEEVKLIASKNRLTAADIKLLLTENKLTVEELKRSVALGKISQEEAIAAMRMAGLNVASMEQVRVLKRGERAWLAFGNTMKKAWGFLKTWGPMVAFTVGMDLWARRGQQEEKAADKASEQAKQVLLARKEANDLFVSLEKKNPETEEDITQAIENMTEALKNGGFYSEELKKSLESTTDVTDKYTLLHKELEKISDEYVRMKDNLEAYLKRANDVGGGWFSDNFLEDVEDFSKSNLNKLVLEREIDSYGTAAAKVLRENLKFIGLRDNLDDIDYKELLKKFSADRALLNVKGYERVVDLLREYRVAINETNDDYKKMTGQIPDVLKQLNLGYDMTVNDEGFLTKNRSRWGDSEKKNYAKYISDYLNSMNLDADSYGYVRGAISKAMFGDVNTLKGALKKTVEPALEQWQQELKTTFKDYGINIPITADTDIDELRKQLKSHKDELQKTINANKPLLLKLGLKIDDLPDNIEDFLSGQNMPAWKKVIYGLALKSLKKSAKERKGIEHIEEQLPGFLPADQDTKTTKKDTKLDALKNRVDLYKKFFSELDNARKTYGGNALGWLKDNGFADVFGWNLSDVTNYGKSLDELTAGFNANTEARKKFIEGVDADKVTQKRKDETEALRDYVNELQRMVGIMRENYDTYKKWFDLTGNAVLASTMSGVTQNTKYTDLLKKRMGEELSKANNGTYGTNIDKVLGLDMATVKKEFGEGSPVFYIWNEYREELKRISKVTEGELYEATKNLLTTQEEIYAVESKISALRANEKPVGDNDPRIINLERQRSSLEAKAFSQSEPYLRFYSAILTMTADEAHTMGASIKKNLADQLANGTITADKYAKSIKNVDDQMKKLNSRKSTLSAFASGGISGVLAKKQADADNRMAASAIAVQKAEENLIEWRKVLNEREKEGNAEAIANAKVRVTYWEKQLFNAKKQNEIDTKKAGIAQKFLGLSDKEVVAFNEVLAVAEMFVGTIEGVAQAFQQLSDMFAATGNDSTAEWFSDAADFTNAVASPFRSSVNAAKSALSGDIGGVISNTVGIFTSPITAFAKLHDKKREREIVKSQRAVKELTIEYQNLQKAMERALGGVYTTGGYNEMLKNLTAQRNEIQRQYELEQDKKDSDADKLTDYKQQLNELDIQLKDFAMDFANAIYGIDLHTWASELTKAVVGAWEKGEDAVKAYRDKVKDLMKDLLKNILAKKVMERAIEALGIDTFIANELVNDDGKLNEGAIPKLVDMLYQVADTTSTAIYNALDYAEDHGYIERGDSSSSSSNSIKSVKENVDDLFLSYLNAIRLDVSMNRMMLSEIVNAMEGSRQMPEIAMAQLEQLRQITDNTKRGADSAAQIYNMLRSLAPDGLKIQVRVV